MKIIKKLAIVFLTVCVCMNVLVGCGGETGLHYPDYGEFRFGKLGTMGRLRFFAAYYRLVRGLFFVRMDRGGRFHSI